MRGNSHIVIGALCGAVMTNTLPITPTISMVLMGAVVGGISALMPDIDHRHSTISRRLRPLRWLVWWLPHRGLTHSVWAVLAVALLSFWIAPAWVAVAIMAGYASHILADMLTFKGVMIFYPLGGFIGSPVRIRTGGLIERVIAFASAVALVAYLVIVVT